MNQADLDTRTRGRRTFAIRALGVVAASVWLVMPSAAFAQSSGSPDPTATPWTNARLKLGAFYFEPTITLKDIGLDKNVFDDSNGAKTDLTGTLSLISSGGVHIRGVVFSATEATDYVWFRRYHSERSLDDSWRFLLEGRSRVIHPWVIYDRAESHDRSGYEIDARVGRTIPLLELGADVPLGFRLGATVAYRTSQTTYAAGDTFDGVDLGQVLNNKTDGLRALARYHITPYTDLTGGTEFERERFSSDPLRDSNSRYYYGGIESKSDAAFSGSTTIGYRAQMHLDSTVPSFRGLVVKSMMAIVLNERTRLSFSGDRDIQESYEERYPFYVQQGGGIGLTERIADHLDVQGNANESWLEYREVLNAADEPRTDRVTIVGLGFGYFLGGANGPRLGIGVEREQRVSPVAGRTYTADRLLTNLKFSF